MKMPRFLSTLSCFIFVFSMAAQEYAAVVEHIKSELVALQKTGLNESRVNELRQGFRDIRKWPDKSAEIGALSRQAFLDIMAALEKDPANTHADGAIHSTLTTLWTDIPSLDEKRATAVTEQFLKQVAGSYTKIRRALASIKPGTQPEIPAVPASHSGKYFSGPIPRPEEIQDEADRAVYEKDYNRYVKERDAWIVTTVAPRRIIMLDRAMGNMLLAHPHRAVGKTEGRMAFFKLTGLPKKDQEALALGDP